MAVTVHASLNERSLNRRLEELRERERFLAGALREVRGEAATVQEQLAALGAKRRTGTQDARIAARTLGTFSVAEVAAELGCTHATAARLVRELQKADPPVLAPAGRALGRPLYEYVGPPAPEPASAPKPRPAPPSTTPAPGGVPPTGWTTQPHAPEVEHAVKSALDRAPTPERHLAPVPDDSGPDLSSGLAAGDLAPERGTVPGVSKNDLVSSIRHKAIRKAVRTAEREGWELQKKGDGHYVLVKGRRRVPVASTPTNPGDSADIIRRMTRARAS